MKISRKITNKNPTCSICGCRRKPRSKTCGNLLCVSELLCNIHNQKKNKSLICDGCKRPTLNGTCWCDSCRIAAKIGHQLRICHRCSKEYTPRNKEMNCNSCLEEQKHKQQNSAKIDRIKAANEKWLLPKPEKKKCKSLEHLNKEAEHKRLFDDKGWSHYLKGREWNRV